MKKELLSKHINYYPAKQKPASLGILRKSSNGQLLAACTAATNRIFRTNANRISRLTEHDQHQNTLNQGTREFKRTN